MHSVCHFWVCLPLSLRMKDLEWWLPISCVCNSENISEVKVVKLTVIMSSIYQMFWVPFVGEASSHDLSAETVFQNEWRKQTGGRGELALANPAWLGDSVPGSWSVWLQHGLSVVNDWWCITLVLSSLPFSSLFPSHYLVPSCPFFLSFLPPSLPTL